VWKIHQLRCVLMKKKLYRDAFPFVESYLANLV
jgi:hypothetical protein